MFFSGGTPFGILKPAGMPPGIAIFAPVGVSIAPAFALAPGAKSREMGAPAATLVSDIVDVGEGLFTGAPCLPRWNAFMRAAISELRFRPLPLF